MSEDGSYQTGSMDFCRAGFDTSRNPAIWTKVGHDSLDARNNPKSARTSPYDINGDEVHRLIPKITNNKRYGSAYVIFQTDRFDADSKWTIHLGALDVDGRKVDIPTLKLCYHPVKKWIGIEPLMKP